METAVENAVGLEVLNCISGLAHPRAMSHHSHRSRLSAHLLIVLVHGLLLADAGRASEPVDPRIAQVENGLLPRIAPKAAFGTTASIVDRMRAYGIPGATIAVIDAGRIAWARGYGVSDVADKTPVTPETLFQAGSISKPVAALGALRLVKESKLALDEDVNAKLRSWRVPENQLTRDEKVTLRRLLSHTAGLTVHGFPGYAVGAPLPSVEQILNGEPPANTAPVRVDLRPGSQYRYSGGGYTVMQLLVADVANQPFESYLQTNVLDAIGMTSSTFSQALPPAFAARRATAHTPGAQRVDGKAHLYPEMAAAGLWTTPSDLARYLLFVQAALRGESNPVLDAELARDMVARQQNSPQGLGPDIYAGGEFARFGHDGVDEGFEAAMVAYVDSGRGMVIMVNTNRAGMFFDEVKGAVARAYAWPGFRHLPQNESTPSTSQAP